MRAHIHAATKFFVTESQRLFIMYLSNAEYEEDDELFSRSQRAPHPKGTLIFTPPTFIPPLISQSNACNSKVIQ